VRPEELLDLLASEKPQGDLPEQQPNMMVESQKKNKNKKQKKPNAYLSERIKWTEGGKTAYGTVMSIVQLKDKVESSIW
jgi:hypothetical protein